MILKLIIGFLYSQSKIHAQIFSFFLIFKINNSNNFESDEIDLKYLNNEEKVGYYESDNNYEIQKENEKIKK